MWILVLIVAPCVLLFALLKYYFSDTKFWANKGVAFVSFSEIGTKWDRLLFKVPFHIMDQRMYQKFRDLKVRYGGTEEFRNPVLYVVDLDLVKHIMVKDFEYFVNRRVLESQKKDEYFGEMLLLKENQDWKDLRSTMSPTFTTGKIRRMFDIFDQSGSKFVNFVKNATKDSNEIDLKDTCGKYTMDVIASVAFGVDSRVFTEANPIFHTMGKRFQNNFSGISGILRLAMVFFMPKVAAFFKVPITDKVSASFFMDMLAKTRKNRETKGEKREDFLQLMMEAQAGQLNPDNEDFVEELYDKDAKLTGQKINKIEITDKIVAQQCLLFFLAGFDTTETMLIFAAYELAVNPDIQEKLALEISDAINENGGKLTYDLVNQMKYLDQVASETLRKYPPGVRTERVATFDYKIPDSDMVLTKGTIAIVPVYGIHHDEEYYPDPEKFDPERFNAENKANRHPYAYMPFGVGPRNCIAMRFALIEGKTAIAKLVHNFILEPSSKTHIPMKFMRNGFMKPEGGMWLSVKPRYTNVLEE